ncbi:MAG: hypothetical protein AAFU77_00670 [Myxococcota bacterium]
MTLRIATSDISRARTRFEKVVRLYRARPTEEMFERVRRAHKELVAAKRDAVVSKWQGKGRCPSCGSPLARSQGSERTHYGCDSCGFSLGLAN